ncbi:hypothetical protein RM53_04085 [Brevundimonas nasdae]|uniref:Uncharacterized protein n=1 Tax=Brevundimonas nasdae TaxID=172043 RepID=A0A0B4E215_9CAUL|nr:hypothetical protein RM53_04085 [Brevundimonas nasdae]
MWSARRTARPSQQDELKKGGLGRGRPFCCGATKSPILTERCMCPGVHRHSSCFRASGTDDAVTYLSTRWMGLMIGSVITSRS